MTDDAPELVPTRLPEPVIEKVPIYRRARLWWAIAAACVSASVLMALVIAWSAYRSEHSGKEKADHRVVNVETQLDQALGDLKTARRQLAAQSAELAAQGRSSNCRARLANNVSDAQASAVLSIGDVALQLLEKNRPQAEAAVRAYKLARLKYIAAVIARGDSVHQCSG